MVVCVHWTVYISDCRDVEANVLRERFPVGFVEIKLMLRWVIKCDRAKYMRKVRTNIIAYENKYGKMIAFMKIIHHRQIR